jgi:hypothetical protein
MLNTIIWALLGAVAVVALPTRQLSALQQAAHVQTPDIANAFIRQMKTKSIAHLLMLDNSLATPYYREVAKRGLGYTCVSVDDNTDPSHRLDRVYRVNRMGDLHPAYASSGTLAVAITVDTPVRAATGRCACRSSASWRNNRACKPRWCCAGCIPALEIHILRVFTVRRWWPVSSRSANMQASLKHCSKLASGYTMHLC